MRLSDLVALRDPRRPPARLQERIASHEPDRVHVVAGEPATVSEMRRDSASRSGTMTTPRAFSAFVARPGDARVRARRPALIGDRYKVPRLVAEQITASAGSRSRSPRSPSEEARDFERVHGLRDRVPAELATVQSRLAIDAFTATLAPMHRRAYDVRTDVDGLERLRELNRKHALIFLPTHRSYVDPLVLGDVLATHDFPRNHLLGGNNLAFWPIGPLGKRAGVVFIRRSFGEDRVYKLAVREYLGTSCRQALQHRVVHRGRADPDGQAAPPKYGLLHYLVERDRRGPRRGRAARPGLDQLQPPQRGQPDGAGDAGAQEEGGGDPLAGGVHASTVDPAGNGRGRLRRAVLAAPGARRGGRGRARLEKVAFRICDGINQATPVTPLSLLTLALLGRRDRALTFEQVRRVVAPLLDYVDSRDLRGRLSELRIAGAAARALDGLVVAGVASRYDGGTEAVWSIAPGNHAVAAFFRNSAMHHFVVRAICELALLSAVTARPARDGGDQDPMRARGRRRCALRDMLKFEFFFADKEAFRRSCATSSI